MITKEMLFQQYSQASPKITDNNMMDDGCSLFIKDKLLFSKQTLLFIHFTKKRKSMKCGRERLE